MPLILTSQEAEIRSQHDEIILQISRKGLEEWLKV
jgi:hypothetical protein